MNNCWMLDIHWIQNEEPMYVEVASFVYETLSALQTHLFDIENILYYESSYDRNNEGCKKRIDKVINAIKEYIDTNYTNTFKEEMESFQYRFLEQEDEYFMNIVIKRVKFFVDSSNHDIED